MEDLVLVGALFPIVKMVLNGSFVLIVEMLLVVFTKNLMEEWFTNVGFVGETMIGLKVIMGDFLNMYH